jgi:hypothetical protein
VIGRSHGGLSTKINIGVDALGDPVGFILTAGQVQPIAASQRVIPAVVDDDSPPSLPGLTRQSIVLQ